jgi:transposase
MTQIERRECLGRELGVSENTVWRWQQRNELKGAATVLKAEPMKLIKGNQALAKELGVGENTICRWLREGRIHAHHRILRSIWYDMNTVFDVQLNKKKR